MLPWNRHRRITDPSNAMSDTLRDQLMGLGFKPAPTPARERKPAPQRGPHKGAPGTASAAPAGKSRKPGQPGRPAKPGRQRTREDIDLAKAYAIRAQKEKDERIEAERQRQEQARLRREARAKLEEFLKGRALNDAKAEIARHFPYGGKIKRVYVNADQLRALVRRRGAGGLARLGQGHIRRRQHALRQGDRIVQIEGLGQELLRTAAEGTGRAGHVGVGRHHDHRQLWMRGLELVQQHQPIIAGHAHIGEQQVRWRLIGQHRQRRSSTVEAFDTVAGLAQRGAQHEAHRAVIVDHPDALGGGIDLVSHGRRCPRRGCPARSAAAR